MENYSDTLNSRRNINSLEVEKSIIGQLEDLKRLIARSIKSNDTNFLHIVSKINEIEKLLEYKKEVCDIQALELGIFQQLIIPILAVILIAAVIVVTIANH